MGTRTGAGARVGMGTRTGTGARTGTRARTGVGAPATPAVGGFFISSIDLLQYIEARSVVVVVEVVAPPETADIIGFALDSTSPKGTGGRPTCSRGAGVRVRLRTRSGP